MAKMGLLKLEEMGEYEKQQGYASYKTIVERYASDMVLCNNIIDIDSSVYDNMSSNCFEYYNNATGEEATKEEYENDNEGIIEERPIDIYQYFLCNLTDFEKEHLENAGVILSYSDMLDLDVICVDHWGTGWAYVLTDVKLFDTYEELEKYENGDED